MESNILLIKVVSFSLFLNYFFADNPGKASFPEIETRKEILIEGKKGSIIKKDIYIKNIGNANLVIEKVDPSCGCTISKFKKSPVRPGDSAVISLEIDTKEKQIGSSYVNLVIISNTKFKYSKVRVDLELK